VIERARLALYRFARCYTPRTVRFLRAQRLPLLLLIVYVCLDLSSPLWPGAFNFDPDDSVEGLRSDQSRQDVAPPVSEPAAGRHPTTGRLLRRVERLPRIAAVTARNRSVQRSQLYTPPDPGPSGDDH
jgi:hypothetical protein